jgi:hypothetical protein
MRKYYSEFVGHWIRYYARHPHPQFHTDVEKENWVAVANALKKFSESDKKMLLDVYRNTDTMPNNVYQVAKRYHIDQRKLWKLMLELENKTARYRRLI